MNPYIFLFSAIAFEVLGTMLLPASQQFSKIIPTVILLFAYIMAFYFLSLSVTKLPLSIVYGSWAGLGVFSVAILSYVFYDETYSWQAIIGLFMIVIGVSLVNIYRA
ncbi:MAG: multidrug efflux SMR transporter [Woeseiaceae bacterium]|jgi:small multidrug resistance pump|nr:multidrug efflux SMR transporter [Woeseiaceae bacterium]MDG1015678.1 multidrug efflux SMR transporter [Woeseiaceae bacterium]MDG1712364.1 multidrug efflux SMR transporter [Woeseiaceae bacterium]MDG1865497.1 multidrug efflux SMR transporter [Woeseiaceae bacterium]|tara:strand:- start:4942 stop:5262 length:321 start_codon:yes stop_codon:yes gene_type:complete